MCKCQKKQHRKLCPPTPNNGSMDLAGNTWFRVGLLKSRRVSGQNVSMFKNSWGLNLSANNQIAYASNDGGLLG